MSIHSDPGQYTLIFSFDSVSSTNFWVPRWCGRSGTLNDLFRFDFAGPTWTNLSSGLVAGAPPSPRYSAGFSFAGGRLFLFGGQTLSGGAN
jgi:hypothetical protein